MLITSHPHESTPASAMSGGVFAFGNWHGDVKPARLTAEARQDHKPIITLLRGDRETAVTGPVDQVRPTVTNATKLGWDKWQGDVVSHAEATKALKDQANRIIKDYFAGRREKKEADFEARCKRAAEKGRPMPKRPTFKEPRPDWMHFVTDEQFVRMMRGASTARQVARRLVCYEHLDTAPLAGRRVKAFKERFHHDDGTTAIALRTALGILSLQLFSSALPKGGIIYGYDKTTVYSSNIDSLLEPIFVRDMPYIETDRNRRCLFVADLDGWWPTVEALRAKLRTLLPPHMMPNLIVYRACVSRGGVENPHAIWLLPPGSRVIWSKGKRKAEQFRLHKMIQRGIVSHLIPLGADPDHHNNFKLKNPLSAAWSLACFDGHFATMDDWRSVLPTITPDPREMKRRAKIQRALPGVEATLSNAIWNDGLAYRSHAIAAAQRTNDPAFLKARRTHRAFVDWLYHPDTGVITRRLVKLHGDTAAVRSILRAQREYVVELGLTPDSAGHFKNRGRDSLRNRMASDLGPTACAADRKGQELERKAEGGRQSRRIIKAVNLGLIAEEIEARMAAGIEVVKSEVVNALVKAGTVSRSVAYARFDHVLEIVLQSARYQAQPSQPSDTTPAQPDQDAPVSTSEQDSGPDQADHPAQTSPSNRPKRPVIVDRQARRAHRIRESWREAVAAWRAARKPEPDDDTDSVLVRVDASPWSRRRHVGGRTIH